VNAPRRRRALSASGGAVTSGGDPAAARLLVAALKAAEAEPDRFTHGFHSYPARMHPEVARILVAELSRPGERVLDPFCGAGTVLVEAMVAGRGATGVDLNPLAIRIAREHCALRSPDERARFEATLGRVAGASLDRVRARQPVRAALSPREREFYQPHVLLELAGLFEEIRRIRPETDRRALEIVFSALLVKFSRQESDTSERHTEKRIRKGLVSEFFLRKGRELSQRWAALSEAAGRDARPPTLYTGDARTLRAHLAREGAYDLVVSSPPYGGTYDYHAHHARRYPWLGLDTRAFEAAEIGARRHLTRRRDAAAEWDREVAAYLRAIAAVCRSGARIALLCGDADLGGAGGGRNRPEGVGRYRVDAREQLARLAPRAAGLVVVAHASQTRPDPRGGTPRHEHLVLLAR
jgi:SAM-dependent methyltransferase